MEKYEILKINYGKNDTIDTITFRFFVKCKDDFTSENFLRNLRVYNDSIDGFEKGERIPFRVLMNKKGLVIEIDLTKKQSDGTYVGVSKDILKNKDKLVYLNIE